MRRAVLLCVVIAAALVAWWLLRDEAPMSDGARPSASAPAATTPPAKSPERTSRRAVVEETRAAAPPQAPARPVETIAEADAGGTLVVVDRSTGQPLAGVRVSFLTAGDDEASWLAGTRAAMANDADATEAITEHGRVLVGDDQGVVSLPKFERPALVAARHGELRGTSVLVAGQAKWRLELYRPVALTALVQDADGRPCGGVKVMVLRHGESGYPVRDATTDAKDGTVHFADAFAAVPATDTDMCAVAAALPFAATPSVVVDPKNPPADPVRLVLPPSGRVRCEVVDEQGATASVVARLRLPAPVDPAGLIRIVPSPLEDAAAPVADGVARFPYVGLGLQLEIEIASTDGSRVTVKQKFAGPTAAGEETVVRVTVGGLRPAVVGRLADAKGAPIAGFALVAAILEPGRATDFDWVFDWGRRVPCTTDANGRFRFAFDRAPGDAASAKLEIGHPAGEGAIWSARRIALVDLPAVLPTGDVDVGDVVYRGTGLLVAGVVVDEEGKPLSGATVAAMEIGGGARRSPDDDVDAVTTGADGRFRLEGDPSKTRVLLGVSLDGRYVADRLSFDTDTTDARVVMLKAGGIAGSLRAPTGTDAGDGRVLIGGVPQDNGDTGYRFRGEGLRISIEQDGRFEVRTLRPGRARVSIRLGWSEDDTILVVEYVEVVAGQVTRDPRLQDVDAAKSLRALGVVVRDRDGRPIEGADVHFRPAGAEKFWKAAGSTDGNGAATVQARAEDGSGRGIDVVVTCRGYRSALVRAAKSDASIVLEPAKPSVVTVRLASGSPLPELPYQLGAKVLWIEPGGSDEGERWNDPRSLAWHDAKFGKDRVLTFETYDAGRYRVRLMLWEMRMNGGGGGSGIEPVPETVIVTVGADGAPAEVFVGVDAEAMKRLTSEKR